MFVAEDASWPFIYILLIFDLEITPPADQEIDVSTSPVLLKIKCPLDNDFGVNIISILFAGSTKLTRKADDFGLTPLL